jgi:hypothetical protein
VSATVNDAALCTNGIDEAALADNHYCAGASIQQKEST